MNLILVIFIILFDSTYLVQSAPESLITNTSSSSTDLNLANANANTAVDPNSKFRAIKYSTKNNHIQTLITNKTNDAVGVGLQTSSPSIAPEEPEQSVDENNVEDSTARDHLDTWEAPALYQKSFPYYLAGYDDENRPIWITEMGRFNVRQVIEQGPESVAILNKYIKQAAYRILKSLHEQPIPDWDVSEIIFITDFDEMGFFQLAHTPTLMYVVHLARTYKDLIANHLGATIVINANYFAEMLINVIKPVFGRVMEKTEVYGTQQSKWLPVLRRLLPPDTIPTWYGGRPSFKPVKIYG